MKIEAFADAVALAAAKLIAKEARDAVATLSGRDGDHGALCR